MAGQYKRYTFGAETRPSSSTPPACVSRVQQPQETIAEVVQRDFFEERPLWPFTCYAPFAKQMSDFGGDTSFEELRYYEMRQAKIEHKPAGQIIQQTAEIMDRVRQRTQQYYIEKCGNSNMNAANQVQLMRHRGSFGQLGSEAQDHSQEAAPDKAIAVYPSSSSAVESLPSSSKTDPVYENVNRPSDQNSVIECKDNPWLAKEFDIIPDEPPPEQYI